MGGSLIPKWLHIIMEEGLQNPCGIGLGHTWGQSYDFRLAYGILWEVTYSQVAPYNYRRGFAKPMWDRVGAHLAAKAMISDWPMEFYGRVTYSQVAPYNYRRGFAKSIWEKVGAHLGPKL